MTGIHTPEWECENTNSGKSPSTNHHEVIFRPESQTLSLPQSLNLCHPPSTHTHHHPSTLLLSHTATTGRQVELYWRQIQNLWAEYLQTQLSLFSPKLSRSLTWTFSTFLFFFFCGFLNFSRTKTRATTWTESCLLGLAVWLLSVSWQLFNYVSYRYSSYHFD